MSKRSPAEVLKWVEQMERTRRFYRRFKRLAKGTPWEGRSRAESLDDVYAFFLNCYHVKDWVKPEARALGLSKDEIEEFVNKTPALALCADICNGLKHLVLKKPPRSGAPHKITDAKASMEFVKTGEKTAVLLQRVEVTIQHGENTIDAFDLATQAIKAWDDLLQPRLNKLMSRL